MDVFNEMYCFALFYIDKDDESQDRNLTFAIIITFKSIYRLYTYETSLFIKGCFLLTIRGKVDSIRERRKNSNFISLF